jgi:hypothetical protein
MFMHMLRNDNMKNHPVSLRVIGLTILLIASSPSWGAVIIDFESFAGPFPLPPGATEDGFLLTDIGNGGLVVPPGYGFPSPSPSVGFGPGGTSSAPALEIVKAGGGFFELLALEYGVYNQGTPVSMTVTGFLGAAIVGVDLFLPVPVPGTPAPPVSALFPTQLAGVTVDRLVFSIPLGHNSPTVLDNIALGSVPLPLTLGLVVIGIAGISYQRRNVKSS